VTETGLFCPMTILRYVEGEKPANFRRIIKEKTGFSVFSACKYSVSESAENGLTPFLTV
jgi:hypothetical protein